MNVFSWLDVAVCEKLMLTFAHFLWQGVAIGLLAGLLGFMMRHRSAQARYLLFTSALLALVTCPPVTYGLLRSPSQPTGEVANTELNSASRTLPDLGIDNSTDFPDVPSGEDLRSNGLLFAETPVFPVLPPGDVIADVPVVQSETTNWPTVVRFLTYCYMLGVVLLLGRFVLGINGAAQIRRSSRLLDDLDIIKTITRRAQALGLRNPPPVLLCQQLLIPAVVGMMRPAILFPAAMMSGLTPLQIEDVLTHELAHIRRYDYLVNVMQRVVESFLFFHPAVWFVTRRIRIEREHCCDDLVIAQGTAPVDYATALLNVVQTGSTSENRKQLSQLVTLSAIGNKSELRRRIERLVNTHQQPQIYLTRKGIIMASLTTSIVLAGSMLFSATFQADEKQENQDTAQTTTQSENETELPETLELTDLPEVASKNGSLSTKSVSKNEDEPGDVENASPEKEESSQKLREQPEAKEWTLVAINLDDGRNEVWLLRKKDKKRITLHIGDAFVVGKSNMSITNIGKSDIELTAGGERLKVALGTTLKDAVTLPSGKQSKEPDATRKIVLKRVDPKSFVAILRNIYPETVIDISYAPDVGIIIRGRKDQVEELQQIASLLDRLDKDLKNDRELKAIDMLLALKRKQDDASPKQLMAFQIRWGKAETIAEVLKDVLKKANASSDHKVEVDPKANRILVFGTAIDMAMVKVLVIQLDRKPEQPAKAENSRSATTASGRNKKNTTNTTPSLKIQRSTTKSAKTSPRETKIFYLKYVQAGFLSELIKEVYKDVEAIGGIGIAVDPRTNTIILSSESKSNLNEIEALIQALDVKQQQIKPVQRLGSGINPFGSQQQKPGISSKKTSTNRQSALRQPAAGQPTDLIRLTESYSNAYRELQLAEAEYEILSEKFKAGGSDLRLEIRKAKVGIDAAKRKLELFKQIAEAESNSTESELKNLTEELSKAGTPQVEDRPKRRMREQQLRELQLRLEILQKLISH